jgi:hypothetical protein
MGSDFWSHFYWPREPSESSLIRWKTVRNNASVARRFFVRTSFFLRNKCVSCASLFLRTSFVLRNNASVARPFLSERALFYATMRQWRVAICSNELCSTQLCVSYGRYFSSTFSNIFQQYIFEHISAVHFRTYFSSTFSDIFQPYIFEPLFNILRSHILWMRSRFESKNYQKWNKK